MPEFAKEVDCLAKKLEFQVIMITTYSDINFMGRVTSDVGCKDVLPLFLCALRTHILLHFNALLLNLRSGCGLYFEV